MKLWLVFLLFDQVAAAWGPLPSDREQCEAAVERMVDEIVSGIPHNPTVRINGRVVKPEDVDARCIYAERKPRRGETIETDT